VIVVSVYSAGLEGNIVHLENGREPNAGVSLMFYVVLPPFFIGLAYLGNMVVDKLGWYITFGLFGIIAVHAAITLPKQIKKYNLLLEKRSGS